MKKRAHIALINSVYPPDAGASGRVANDLVRHLVQEEFMVTVITSQRDYKRTNEPLPAFGAVKRMKTLNWKRPYLLRLISALWDSYRLLIKAKKKRPDYYIICTDPPFLHLMATVLLKRERWLLWTMDLYPEAFIAHGLVEENNWLVTRVKNRLKKWPPSGIIALGRRQRDFLYISYRFTQELSVALPCGLTSSLPQSALSPEWRSQEDKIYIGYTGNIGEAHSAEFIMNVVRHSDPSRHQVILSIFGTKAKKVKEGLKNKPNVIFLSWIPEEEMPFLDIQMVTLAHKWTHVCVPSKAVSAISLGIPLVFHGSREGDIPFKYDEAIWQVDNQSQAIVKFFDQLTTEQLSEKKAAAQKYSAQDFLDQKEGYSRIVKFLENG